MLSALAILILAVAQYLLVPEPWQVLSVLQDGMRTKSPEGLEDAFHKAIKIEKHEGLQDGLRHDLALASMVLSFILFAVLAKASWPRPGSGQGNGHGA